MSGTLRSLVRAVALVAVPRAGLEQVSERNLARGTSTDPASPPTFRRQGPAPGQRPLLL